MGWSARKQATLHDHFWKVMNLPASTANTKSHTCPTAETSKEGVML